MGLNQFKLDKAILIWTLRCRSLEKKNLIKIEKPRSLVENMQWSHKAYHEAEHQQGLPVHTSDQIEASQEEYITKIIDYSTAEMEHLSANKQLEIIFNGLQGLLGYELVMKRDKFEELMKKLRGFLYVSDQAYAIQFRQLSNYIISDKLKLFLLSPSQADYAYRDFCELLFQEMVALLNRSRNEDLLNQQFKRGKLVKQQEKSLQLIECQQEIKELRSIISKLEVKIAHYQKQLNSERLFAELKDLKSINKKLSVRNDFLEQQNYSLISKIQLLYDSIANFNSQLSMTKLTDIKPYSEQLQVNLNQQLSEIHQLKLNTPEKLLDIDFSTNISDLTPRPDYEYLISKAPHKALKSIRSMRSTKEIVEHLIKWLALRLDQYQK